MSSKVTYEITPIEKLQDGVKYRVKITGPKVGWYDDMYFVVENELGRKEYKINHKENDEENVYFESDVYLDRRTNYRYFFTYQLDGQQKFFKNKEIVDNDIYREEMFKMPVDFSVPDWAQGAIIYHIFVDRFNRGSKEPLKEMPRRTIHKSWDEPLTRYHSTDKIWNNDFYGGDLQGIIDKLDYIQQFGTEILYLSPVSFSQSNHGYDVSDYENVDPYKGTNEDLKKLCDEAHKRGMKVILDVVFNHTGSDSKYYNEYGEFPEVGAYQSDDSKYRSFYKKVYNQEKGEWVYQNWWGMPNLIVCDCEGEAWKNYITGEGGVIDQWFALGVDGLRIDVADDPNLNDEFLRAVYEAVIRNKKDGFIIGEFWDNAIRSEKDCLGNGKGLHSFMNYMLMDALVRYIKCDDKQKLEWTLNDLMTEFADEILNSAMNSTSTHDIPRPLMFFALINEFSENSGWYWRPINEQNHDYCLDFKLTEEQYERAKELFKTYAATLNFLPGNFTIFYGDEAGMQGLGNLANRKPFPWGEEDNDLIEFFTSLGKIRTNNQFLRKAKTNILKLNKDYFMFERTTDEESMLYAVNATDRDVAIDVPDEYNEAPVVYTLKKSTRNNLGPRGAIALKNSNK